MKQIRLLILTGLIAMSTTLPAQKTTSELWEAAKTEMANGAYNYNRVCDLLNAVIKQTSTGATLNSEAKLLLAQVYGNELKIESMQTVIDDLQLYIKNYPDDRETAADLDSIIAFKNEIIRHNTVFFDDICGVWVSDFSISADKIPYLAFTVEKKTENGKYEATILPFCSLYAKIKSESAARGLNTSVRNNHATLYFGSETHKKGNPFAAQMGIAFVGGIAKEIIKHFEYKRLSNPGSFKIGNILGSAATDVLMNLAFNALIELSVKKTYTTTFDMLVERVFAGCVDITINENQYLSRSDGQKSETHYSKRFMMYKLYPEYDVTFAINAYSQYTQWVKNNASASVMVNMKTNKKKICTFGSKQPTDEEIEKFNINQKNIKDFNTQAYEKLKNKVLDSYAHLSENPEDDPLMIEINENFEYCTKGSLHINGKYYKDFTGITKGRDGLGFSCFSYGDEYTGEWKNNMLHGKGFYKWASGAEYDGEWKNGKRNGKGYNKWADGRECDGEWKNDNAHGAGIFKWKDGSVFEGTFKNGYMDKGIKKYAKGEIISVQEGVWANNEAKFTGKITYADGGILEGENNSGKIKGKLTYPDHRFEGVWETKKGIFIRTGILYDNNNGDRYEGIQHKNKKDGTWLKNGKGKMIYANGETVIGEWKDDKLVKEHKRTVNKTK
ncbi:MAG: hypothetical protein LBD45_00820 [Bacteroidales bacterium]|jgi:hypothetical protein|nr:hypothetical protein [Bacteroidales bacterium]